MIPLAHSDRTQRYRGTWAKLRRELSPKWMVCGLDVTPAIIADFRDPKQAWQGRVRRQRHAEAALQRCCAQGCGF
jgi:hypothetical protein